MALVEPLIPPASVAAAGVKVRELLNAIFYVLDGLPVAGLAEDLPPKSTAHYYFMLWD